MAEAKNLLKTQEQSQSQLHNKNSSTHSRSTPSLNLFEFSQDISAELLIKSKSESNLIKIDKKSPQLSIQNNFVDKNFVDNLKLIRRQIWTKNFDHGFSFKRMLIDGFAKIEKILKSNLISNSTSNEGKNPASSCQTPTLFWTRNKALKSRYLPKFLLF
ncbi:hypothetical protein BpHYR1_050240 [Brachionus plicatilis]|uniref:Uncharacterized protein n=1 Tax=Brachionus plicatilis TaxID=10195 RepID=A0A3M7RK59_BRAPC|nr:hypothetical protein BpHYR1_050240 [Brachionus plicatilis]